MDPNVSPASIQKESGPASHSSRVSLGKGCEANPAAVLQDLQLCSRSIVFQGNKLTATFHALTELIYAPCKGILSFPLQTGSHLC